MHRQRILLGHVVVHNSENAFLHLSCVRAAQDDLFLGGEVHVDSVLALDVGQLRVGYKFAGIQDSEISACGKVLFDLILRRSLKHLLHEQRVVRPGRDDSGLELVAGVPASVLVDDEDSFTHVEEVDGSALVSGEAFR